MPIKIKNKTVTQNVDNEIYDVSDLDDVNTEKRADMTNIDELDDIELFDNSKETLDFNYEKEDNNRAIPQVHIGTTQQQSHIIGFDFIKLKLNLGEAKDLNFDVASDSFFRNKQPEIPTKVTETSLMLYDENRYCRQMTLSEEEQQTLEAYNRSEQRFRAIKLQYPNAKPFYNVNNQRIGLGHMYFKNGEFIVSFTGKIISNKGSLGLINDNNIDDALNVIKSTQLVNFNNEAFIRNAMILSVHVTNDLLVSDINTSIRAFSSFMPLRTDRYCVLKYGNNGYEVLSRGKQSRQTPKYQFCIYNKGAEIREHHQRNYIRRIGESGVGLAQNTLRMELKLRNFPAIRKFLAPALKHGSLTLSELLACQQRPIIEMLSLLNITIDKLKEARGNYIAMVENEEPPTQAEFERMHGLIKLLEQNEYDLDKVRSYVEAEIKRKTHSTYFKEKRDILQRYITCYMPQTVATLTELLQAMSY